MARSPLLKLLSFAGLLNVMACGGAKAPQCSVSGETKGSVVVYASFARVLEDGVAEGLDVDDVQSPEGDPNGCYKQDFTGTDGEFGVDNQFGTLLPLIESFVGGDNIDALLTAAIANGQLLIMLGISGVDDPVNDDCVDVTLGAGLGKPVLNTQGEYELYQTFGFDTTDTPMSVLSNGKIEDGVLTAGPGDAVLPVNILDAQFNLPLYSTRLRFDVSYDPLVGGIALDGVAAGGIEVSDLEEIVPTLNIGNDVIGAFLPIVGSATDLGMRDDGLCHQVSAALKMRTVQAFVFEGE